MHLLFVLLIFLLAPLLLGLRLLHPLLGSLSSLMAPYISLDMTTAANGDPPLSLLLRLLDLPNLLWAEAGASLVQFQIHL
jgi:hypothetical protein